MKDIIDGINYWIYWYEYSIWGGSWSLIQHLSVMWMIIFGYAFGISFIFLEKFNLKGTFWGENMVIIVIIVSLIITLILAGYLLQGKRYRRILANHDKYDGWEEKYQTWATSVSILAVVSWLAPIVYMALSAE